MEKEKNQEEVSQEKEEIFQEKENVNTEQSDAKESSETSIEDNSIYQELNNKYLRLYAEFENFRNRSAKESLENYANAGADITKKIIPILDNLERSIQKDNQSASLEDMEKGIQLIIKQFKDTLQDAGLEIINPEGEEFDPKYHEAMMQSFHDTAPENHVIEVFQKGYLFRNKILKHSQVIISKGKEIKE